MAANKPDSRDGARANSDVVRWQLDIPSRRAADLDRFMAEYGFATKKDLVNTAMTFLEWAVNEVKTGRIIASVDEKNSRYKQLDLPAFRIAASAIEPAAILTVMQNELDNLAEVAPKSEDIRRKAEAVRAALDELAAAV